MNMDERRTENRSFWLGLAAGLIILCLLGLPLFKGQVYKHDDLSRYHLPMRFFYAQSLASGDSFLWLPSVLCGFYLHGDGGAGMLHPLHLILYSIFPFGAAFNLEMLLNYPFMMAGMFLFLRRWQIPRDASVFGALVFTFSGFNLLHYVHYNAVSVAAHIPWLLFSIDVALRGIDGRQVAFAKLGVGLFTASQLLLGHPQVFWISSSAEALYTLLLLLSLRCWGRLPALGIAKLLGVLAGGIQLIPSWDALSITSRTDPAWSRYWPSLRPIHILQLLSPYSFNDFAFRGIPYELKIYIGTLPVILLALLIVRRKELGALRTLATGVIGLATLSGILSLGQHGYLYRLQTLVPVIGAFRAPCRYILLFQLALAIGASIAYTDISRIVQSCGRLAWRKLWPLGLAPLASISLAVLFLLAKAEKTPTLAQHFASGVASRNLILSDPLLMILAGAIIIMAARGKRWAFAGMILFAVADQGIYGLTYIRDNEPGTKLEGFYGFAPTPPDVSRYRLMSDDNVWLMKGVRIAGGFVCIPPRQQLEPMSLARLRVANVHWVWEKHKQGLYALSGSVYGAEVPAPLPRARLVAQALVGSDPKSDIDTIDVETTALVPSSVALQEGTPGKATITHDHPGKIRVATLAETKQLLILSESYHKGWQASVDGRERPVVRVYGDFMGCVVDAGRHDVEFSFRPRSLLVGAWMSAAGLGLMAAFFLISWTSQKRRHV